jgi:hypothetical protein
MPLDLGLGGSAWVVDTVAQMMLVIF